MNWIIKPFSLLTLQELYNLLALRAEVFVVEQNCPYLDTDQKDQEALHLMGIQEDGRIMAYARLFAPGIYFPEASIGRVVTAPAIRKGGWGRKLMEEALREMHEIFPGETVKISAQLYLKGFYESLGFIASGNTYLEDDIPHIAMYLEHR